MDPFQAPTTDYDSGETDDTTRAAWLGVGSMAGAMLGPWTCYLGNIVGLCLGVAGLVLAQRTRAHAMRDETKTLSNIALIASLLGTVYNALMCGLVLLIITIYGALFAFMAVNL